MSGELGDPVDHYNVLYRKENGADKNQGDKIGLELFVENADKRSTFVSTELPAILRNERILTINEQNKQTFAQKFI